MQASIEDVGGEAGEREKECDILIGPGIIEHQTFIQTAPGPSPDNGGGNGPRDECFFVLLPFDSDIYLPRAPVPPYTNPQTVAFCRMLGIEDWISLSPVSKSP